MAWTAERVLTLAPDAGSARAARGLASARPWSGLGRGERAVWGRCQGGAAEPYDVAVDLAGPAYHCTCPSRKVPCKHALGLLLRWAGDEAALPPAPAPAWVSEWLADRDAREARAARRAGAAVGTAEARASDPEARARRAAERAGRIAAGLEELDRWLADLVRQGLAAAPGQPYRFWDEMGARLVDAQAPGVGGRVRRLVGTVHRGGDWPARLLDAAGRLHLVTAGWPRLERLQAGTRADLRTVVGWAWSTEEVLAGPRVRDRWLVAGQRTVDDDRLRTRRTWLWGERGGQPALVLEFAHGEAPFAGELAVGTVVDADLAFYPGSVRQRALVAERHGDPEPGAGLPGWERAEDALAAAAAALATNPWLERVPAGLARAVPVRGEGGWVVVDPAGDGLPLAAGDAEGWVLAALSGDKPLAVFGELEDGALRPLAAAADGRVVGL